MPATYTIDASVFLNAFNERESGHETSRALLQKLQAEAVPLIEPTLLLPEISAAIRRGHGDEDLARQFALAVEKLPQIMLVALDDVLARQSADVAARHSLRGSDAVYVAVANRYGCALVSLDKEQLSRTKTAVQVLTPQEALMTA